MLLFSTMLDINDIMMKDDFIRLVIRWNRTNPYPENVIEGIEWHGEHNVTYGDDRLRMDIKEYGKENIIAVRYEKKRDDGSVWDTDYVMNFNTMKMAIRLDRSYTRDALAADTGFSTPQFISFLIEKGYIKDDDGLKVLAEPQIIKEADLPLVAEVINGKRYRLPVVYISRTYYDDDPVNVKKLAARLKGAAHVLVQENSITSPKLREMCDSNNEYNGSIGIYFPDQAKTHRRFIYRDTIGYDSFLMERAVRTVIQYSNSQMTDILYTWPGVNNAMLRDDLASKREELADAEKARREAELETVRLKDIHDEEERRIKQQAIDAGKAETDKILESFEEDMAGLQKQIDDLTRANEILANENYGLKLKLDSNDSIPVIYMGEEYDFYPGEVKDMLLSVLSDALSGIPDNTRRKDIVRDILENNDYLKITEGKKEEIKRLLTNYDGMPAKLKQALTDMGFEITADGKHYKVTYYGDGRYQMAFSKTPSDVKTGKNMVKKVIRTVY